MDQRQGSDLPWSDSHDRLTQLFCLRCIHRSLPRYDGRRSVHPVTRLLEWATAKRVSMSIAGYEDLLHRPLEDAAG